MTVEKKLSPYEKELRDSLEKIAQYMPHREESRYFVQQAYQFFSLQGMSGKNPGVILSGTSFPEEILYAFGLVPFWVLGGSFASSVWVDDMVPRDTDPVSRSVLGYLSNEFFNLTDRALIIIPLVNDSSRKQAYMLKAAGKKVCTVSLPSQKNSVSEQEWMRQIGKCVRVLEKHTHRLLTKHSMKKAGKLVQEAKNQARIFLKLSGEKPGLVHGIGRMFILNSYYFTDNVQEWSCHMESVNRWLAAGNVAEKQQKSKVLLAGSPVYFPNYKIPFMLQEVGMEIAGNIDYSVWHLTGQPERQKDGQGFLAAGATYRNDCSSAYINNDMLYHAVAECIREKNIDGVVWHVLKGQIEYDFELERMEKLFEKQGIPVFRLETDYNRQDIEQLRIRMEAFAEVLEQKKYQKGAAG